MLFFLTTLSEEGSEEKKSQVEAEQPKSRIGRGKIFLRLC
jgi:hypothetical protein